MDSTAILLTVAGAVGAAALGLIKVLLDRSLEQTRQILSDARDERLAQRVELKAEREARIEHTRLLEAALDEMRQAEMATRSEILLAIKDRTISKMMKAIDDGRRVQPDDPDEIEQRRPSREPQQPFRRDPRRDR